MYKPAQYCNRGSAQTNRQRNHNAQHNDVRIVFERHIVWPDGRKEIEGETPKALPAPHALPTEGSKNDAESTG